MIPEKSKSHHFINNECHNLHRLSHLTPNQKQWSDQLMAQSSKWQIPGKPETNRFGICLGLQVHCEGQLKKRKVRQVPGNIRIQKTLVFVNMLCQNTVKVDWLIHNSRLRSFAWYVRGGMSRVSLRNICKEIQLRMLSLIAGHKKLYVA